MSDMTGKVAALTALLVAIGALVDVGGRMISATEPATCKLGFSLGFTAPWCGPRTKSYTLLGTAKATSSGQDGTRITRLCEPPPEGWHFVPGTGMGIPVAGHSESASGGFGTRGATQSPYRGDVTPQRACFDVWAYTGDERVPKAFEGTGTVIIER
jgi:hypothetical protein